MTRGEIYRSRIPTPERGNKGGYFVVVSRNAVALNEAIETVICAPVYSRWQGLNTEVPLTRSDGLDHDSAIKCDFLTLLPKKHLTHLTGRLNADKLDALDAALAAALSLPAAMPTRH